MTDTDMITMMGNVRNLGVNQVWGEMTNENNQDKFSKEVINEIFECLFTIVEWWATPDDLQKYFNSSLYDRLKYIMNLQDHKYKLQPPFDSNSRLHEQYQSVNGTLGNLDMITDNLQRINKTSDLLHRLGDLGSNLRELRDFIYKRMYPHIVTSVNEEENLQPENVGVLLERLKNEI